MKIWERFNPRAPCGARLTFFLMRRPQNLFQPTRPLRGATERVNVETMTGQRFQPTRPLRGATCGLLVFRSGFHISTHAPLAGRDGCWRIASRSTERFQPTRPLRGATYQKCFLSLGSRDFNPRAPCGARPLFDVAKGGGEVKFQPTRPLRGATWRWKT